MNQSETEMLPIANRVSAPTPELVREARERAGLSQAQAAQLISASATKPYRTWQNYESPVGSKGHRAMPLGLWELFLLLTHQHPLWSLQGLARPHASQGHGLVAMPG